VPCAAFCKLVAEVGTRGVIAEVADLSVDVAGVIVEFAEVSTLFPVRGDSGTWL